MNKSDLVKKVAAKTGSTKMVAADTVDAVFAVITEALIDNCEVRIPGFGNFFVVERAALEGRNPKTGETIQIAPQKLPKFKTGKALKLAVNSD